MFVSDELLIQLMDMGFSAAHCKKALEKVPPSASSFTLFFEFSCECGRLKLFLECFCVDSAIMIS